MTDLVAQEDIPKEIIEKLVNGLFDRIGGAIREVGTKKTVAFLRGSYDLCDPQLLSTLGLSLGAISPMTLAISTMGFLMVKKCIGNIEDRMTGIQRILDEINYKLDLSFYANFKAALDRASAAFISDNKENRREFASRAIDRFSEAKCVYKGSSY